ncbi:MAG: glycosyltransferase family 4 protein [Bacillota bacterium]
MAGQEELRYDGPVVWVVPYLQTGGTEHHLLYLLQAVHWAVQPVVLGPPGPLGATLEAAGARVHYFQDPRGNWWRGLRSYLQSLSNALLPERSGLQEGRQGPRAVVHVHGAAELAWLAAGRVRRAGAALLFTAHGYFGSGAPWTYRIGSHLLRSMRIPLIAVSADEAARWAKTGFPREQITVVHNGVPDTTPAPTGETSLSQLAARNGSGSGFSVLGVRVPDGSVVVGVAARLEPQKGVHVLLEALRLLPPRHPEFHCVIMGDGSERARLEARVRESGLEQRVFFTGKVVGASRWFTQCDIVCLPSLDEALPLSIIEAMAAGCAVVATSVGGIPEVVRDGVDGLLVPPGDPEALARALSRLASDPKTRARMQRAARARYEEAFTARRMAARTLEIYRRLSAAPAPSATGASESGSAGDGPSSR